MLKTGLVSITFRKLEPEEIVKLVSKAGLDGIEWGGDIHVPHGDIKRAQEVYRMTNDLGLSTAAYGSYYKVGVADQNLDEFKKIVETAAQLHAPTIRVWAGNKSSADSDEAAWDKLVNISRKMGDIADEANISISFEYHGGTLTDTNESALRLLSTINHKNIKSYWQPPVKMDFAEKYAGLLSMLKYLENIHVFKWINNNGTIDRRPLSEGIEEWTEFFKQAQNTNNDHFAMIEFVKDDTPYQFEEDAKTLKYILSECLQ